MLSHVALGGKHDRGSCTGDHRGDRQGVGKRGKCQRQRYREKLTLSYRVRMLIKSASYVRPCRRGDHRNSRLRGVFSPLRTDSRQLVSKICWCVKTFGEMMNVPKWLEPIGFFSFAHACAGRFGRMRIGGSSKIACTAEGSLRPFTCLVPAAPA